MRSDLRALLKILGASFLLAVVLMVFTLPVLGVVSIDVTIYLALGVFPVGLLAIGRVFGPALSRRGKVLLLIIYIVVLLG